MEQIPKRVSPFDVTPTLKLTVTSSGNPDLGYLRYQQITEVPGLVKILKLYLVLGIIEEGKVKKYSPIEPKKNYTWSEQTKKSMIGYLLMKGLHNVFNIRKLI